MKRFSKQILGIDRFWLQRIRRRKQAIIRLTFLGIVVTCFYFVVFSSKETNEYSFIPVTTNLNEVDIVYTWVDGNDPYHIKLLDEYKSKLVKPDNKTASANRFQDHDELKYSLRSVEQYAPWARNIIIVTNGQRPKWLNLSHPKIKLITHEQIFPSKSSLPTFNSYAIEANLHRIPGLTQRFLYFNDDFVLGHPIQLEHFFKKSTGFQIRLAWSAPKCGRFCPDSWLGDAICDNVCNAQECYFDRGDCISKNEKPSVKFITVELRNRFAPTKSHPIFNYKSNLSYFGMKLFKALYENYYAYLNWLVLKGHSTEKESVNKLEYLLSDIQSKLPNLLVLLAQFLGLEARNKNMRLFDFLFRINNDVFYESFNENEIQVESFFKEKPNKAASFQKRKLLDVYMDSVVHVDRLFNNFYGYARKQVPSHVPVLIDKDIMAEMQEEFKEEFEITSSNRFRTSRNMLYTFSYYYYIMSKFKEFDVESFFNEFDIDQNGVLSPGEILIIKLRVLSTQFSTLNITNSESGSFKFQKYLDECNLISEVKNQFSKSDFAGCDSMTRFLRKHFWIFNVNDVSSLSRLKYKFEIVKTGDVGFLMMSNNFNWIKEMLGKWKAMPPRFMCINDDITYGSSLDSNEVRKILKDFFEHTFPKKSAFEL
jgi:UDP-N-acetylglucosamine-lysosomal-enzyme